MPLEKTTINPFCKCRLCPQPRQDKEDSKITLQERIWAEQAMLWDFFNKYEHIIMVGGASLFLLSLWLSDTVYSLVSWFLMVFVQVAVLCFLGDYLLRIRHDAFRRIVWKLTGSGDSHIKYACDPEEVAAKISRISNPQVKSGAEKVHELLQKSKQFDGSLRSDGVELGWPLSSKMLALNDSSKRPVVLITGAAFGLGRGMAEKYASMGYNLILWDIQKNELVNLQVELEEQYPHMRSQQGGSIIIDRVDVSDDDIVETHADTVSRVDLLILNAGVVNGKSVLESKANEIERVFRVNVFHLFNVARSIVPKMITNVPDSDRRIVVVGSVAGFAGAAKVTDYNGSKAASNIFAEGLSAELRNTNVKVTLICPNVINTGMFAGFGGMRFFPMLEAQDVVNSIIDAVRYRKRWVVLPWRMCAVPFAKYTLPWFLIPLIDKVIGASNSMDTFKGSTAYKQGGEKDKDL